jgi:signal transduction histidine kinase
VGACLAVAIQLGDHGVGMACVGFSQSQSFDPAAVTLMQVFAERVARAIERSQAVEERESKRRELERQVAHQQDQLVRSERLAAIGLVGGSIAHELRNPLGVISNAVYFLRRRADPLEGKMRRHLEIIEREVQHSLRIIKGLVDYSAGIEPESRRLDMNRLIRTALEYTAVPETITVDLELDDRLPTVVGDESQLLQVLEHLIRNAVQAMEEQGTLTITSGASEVAVWTTVRDTGPGVAPADQMRIFEPLVTTRAKGMGLGLSLGRKIAEAHGGEIRLSSQPGSGAAFTVELPITDHLPGPSMRAQADLTPYR